MAQFGKYEILEQIGAGGMALVYRARDTFLGRTVALKVIQQSMMTSANDVAAQRFLNEARLVGGLTHPNILVVYDLGIQGGNPFIAMEYLSGCDLRDLIEQKHPLGLEQKAELILQVASALEYAHGQGIVHRDIKPGNIRVLRSGVAKLMDFGIAKLTHSDSAKLTRTGNVIGSVSYMSPEQVQGDSLGPASDQFSLGIVFYELLTGRLPFPGEIAKVLFRIAFAPPLPFTEEEQASLPEPLRALLLRCLEKDPAARFPTLGDFASELTHLKSRGLLRPGLGLAPVGWIPESFNESERQPQQQTSPSSLQTLERLATGAGVSTQPLPQPGMDTAPALIPTEELLELVERPIPTGTSPPLEAIAPPEPQPSVDSPPPSHPHATSASRRWLLPATATLLLAAGLAFWPPATTPPATTPPTPPTPAPTSRPTQPDLPILAPSPAPPTPSPTPNPPSPTPKPRPSPSAPRPSPSAPRPTAPPPPPTPPPPPPPHRPGPARPPRKIAWARPSTRRRRTWIWASWPRRRPSCGSCPPPNSKRPGPRPLPRASRRSNARACSRIASPRTSSRSRWTSGSNGLCSWNSRSSTPPASPR